MSEDGALPSYAQRQLAAQGSLRTLADIECRKMGMRDAEAVTWNAAKRKRSAHMSGTEFGRQISRAQALSASKLTCLLPGTERATDFYGEAQDTLENPLQYVSHRKRLGYGNHLFDAQFGRGVAPHKTGQRSAVASSHSRRTPEHWEPGHGYSEKMINSGKTSNITQQLPRVDLHDRYKTGQRGAPSKPPPSPKAARDAQHRWQDNLKGVRYRILHDRGDFPASASLASSKSLPHLTHYNYSVYRSWASS